MLKKAGPEIGPNGKNGESDKCGKMVISGKQDNCKPDMCASNVKMLKRAGPKIDTLGKNRKTHNRAKMAQLEMGNW